MNKCKRMAALGILATVLLVAGNQPAIWAQGGAAVGDCDPPNIPVRAKQTFFNRNAAGQAANDFHLYMYQNDKPSVRVTGAQAQNDVFTIVNLALDTDNGRPNPPPGFHGAHVNMSGGVVPNNGSVTIEMVLCMNEKNVLKIKDVDWTIDGVSIPPIRPLGQIGFRVRGPVAGGNGGNPGDPGGGGQGAQEGDGGTGNYIHVVCIENDDDLPVVLVELKLLASMTHYDDLEDINWDIIDPIQNDEIPPEPPVEIPPHSVWCYHFETTGTYIGGHVYKKYSISWVGGAAAGNVDYDITFGDHPVQTSSSDIPTLTEWGLIIFGVALLGFITWMFLKRRKLVAVKA